MADLYVVVQCFNTAHRRVNDVLAHDPKCHWCKGVGLVRILRDHVPVVRRAGDVWDAAPSVIEEIANLDEADPCR